MNYPKAMLHEFFTIQNNVIDLRRDKTKKDEEQEFVLSSFMDPFFEEHLYDDFGEIAEAVKIELQEYTALKEQNKNIESIEQMQRVLESMPEIKRKANNIGKHVNLVSEMSKLVSDRHLIDFSRVEQEMTVKESKTEHYKAVMELLMSEHDNYDKLRLALIYAIRYESDSQGIQNIKKGLESSGVSKVILKGDL